MHNYSNYRETARKKNHKTTILKSKRCIPLAVAAVFSVAESELNSADSSECVIVGFDGVAGAAALACTAPVGQENREAEEEEEEEAAGLGEALMGVTKLFSTGGTVTRSG